MNPAPQYLTTDPRHPWNQKHDVDHVKLVPIHVALPLALIPSPKKA